LHAEPWDTEARLAQLRTRRQRQARKRTAQRLAMVGLCVVAVMAVALSFVYAGSSGRLADGVEIAGVDVGGLSAEEAESKLERRAAAVVGVPLAVSLGNKTYRIRPTALGLTVDWQAAVDEARAKVSGFRPVRGFRRFSARAFGAEISPTAVAGGAALDRFLDRIARGDLPHRDASIKLTGLHPVVVEGRAGRVLDRRAAEAAIVAAVATLDRSPITLATRTDELRVTAAMLEPALEQARLAVSAPVRLDLGRTHYRLPPWRVATLLKLPAGGTREVRVSGRRADAYFAALAAKVNSSAKNAEFVVASGGHVLIKPAVNSRALDVPRTAENLFAAALRPARRVAPIVVGTNAPARSTAEAKKMGVTGVVSSYTTIYGGDANRVHNVQLVANLIDNTLIAPGRTFSFNGTTGERNAAKGFLEAPVIINGELQTGLGGGVCQVSTTAFNAAYEAGLNITARTNHALYISHYPQGRDATVNYPDTDLKFVNDTGHWLLLRTFAGSSSLTVNLYGTPQHRRVESEVAPLRTVGSPPVTWRKDPTLTKGRRVVYASGSPSLATSVHRRVYDSKGDLLHDNVWFSSYRGEKKIVLVGTKPKPKEKPAKPDAPQQPAPTGGGV
jgi:vancomycin resistance protein YoaR